MSSAAPGDPQNWLAKLTTDSQRAARAPSLILGWSGGTPLASVICGAGDVPGEAATTQYRIGSITKTFTAAVVMRLQSTGAIELDQPLTESAPGLAGSRATLRDVLAHMAGIRENPDGPWWELGFSRSSQELFAAGTEPLMTSPSTYGMHHYSNLGYALVGWLLEQTTGQTWDALISEQLLAPLGLTRTTLMPSAPHAVGHVLHPWHETVESVPLSGTGGMAPAGQLWSSVGDLLRWGRCLLGDDREILSRDIVEEMRRPRVMGDENWRDGQGTGLQLWRDAEAVYAGHGGSVPGFCAALVTHRPSGNAVAVCANSSSLAGTDPVSLGLNVMRDAVLRWPAAVPAWRPKEPPPAEVQSLTGRWWTMTSECDVTYEHHASALAMAPVGAPGPVSWFRQETNDTWRGWKGRAAGELLRIERDDAEDVVELSIGGVPFRRAPHLEM